MLLVNSYQFFYWTPKELMTNIFYNASLEYVYVLVHSGELGGASDETETHEKISLIFIASTYFICNKDIQENCRFHAPLFDIGKSEEGERRM